MRIVLSIDLLVEFIILIKLHLVNLYHDYKINLKITNANIYWVTKGQNKTANLI